MHSYKYPQSVDFRTVVREAKADLQEWDKQLTQACFLTATTPRY
jgi:hypothetical protein